MIKTKVKSVSPSTNFNSEVFNMPNVFLKDAVFDLSGLSPLLNKDNSQLVLSVPAFQSKEPMINHVFAEDLKAAGLTDLEIEEIAEEFFRALEKKLFVKALADRLMK